MIEAEIITKGEFAALIGVTPGRVSQMISEGKITGPALRGEGRTARIVVNVAKRQIAERTDIGQRFGNGLGTRLEITEPTAPANAVRPTPAPSSDLTADLIKSERLRALQLQNERAAEERAVRQGRYVLAADTSAAMGRLAGELMNVFEGGLGDLAQALAARFQLPARDVLHQLRAEFTTIRRKAAAATRERAAGLPALVEDDVADALDPAMGEA